MRELKTKDVFKLSRILKKMDLKNEMNVEGKSQEQFGAELIIAIGENIHMAQKEINEFIGDLVGITGDEFNELPFGETLKHIEEFKNMEGIKDFFKQASQLTEKMS